MNFYKTLKQGLGEHLRAGIMAALFLMLSAGSAQAATITEAFLMLPNTQTGGFSRVEREMMLEAAVDGNLLAGQSQTPDVTRPWIRIIGDNFMELHRPGHGPINYKLFEGSGFQLLAICRGRLSNAPIDPVCPFDLCLYRLDREGLTQADQDKYLPSLTILDFITPEMLDDPRAAVDVASRGPNFTGCLACNASIHDSLALDIITYTAINASACANFLPPYNMIRLTWNGLGFTKPYDRAAPREISN